jgi:hypothetical protein
MTVADLCCSIPYQHTSITESRSCKLFVRLCYPVLTACSEKLKAKYDEEVAQKPRGTFESLQTRSALED